MKTPKQPRISWRDQSGFFLSGMMVRFLILLILFGVAAYDTTQVVVAQIKAESVSRAAALAGADTYYRSKRPDWAERDALTAAQSVDPSARIISFAVANDGSVVVEASKRANTLVVKRLGLLKKYNVQKASDQEIRTQ
ncbi:MAG TPA: hypothetical protein VEQ37_19180 [Actinomycetota bacterium]|nr:hypothetical protein [Actinomycetota bacterium]